MNAISPQTDVVGIGLCTVDLLFNVPQLPAFDRSVRAAQYLRQSGGPVPSALVALSRLGASTRFIGRIGDDDDGRFIRTSLEGEGVDTGCMIVESGALSRISLVLVDQQSGERCFTSRPETCAPLIPADLCREDIASARILHLDDADAISLQAARWAREAGVLVVLDGTWVHEDLDQLLTLVDVPIVSNKLADRWMPSATPEEVVRRLAGGGARIAAMTLGERGCVVLVDNELLTFPAFSVDVVDTTGAGDAFHGGFIYGLLQGWGIEEIARFAAAVAALNCRQLGGQSGLPTRDEVEDFLAGS